MKKIFSLFAALTLGVGLWAIDNVQYIDADGNKKTVNGVTEITNASSTLAAGWYVVKGSSVYAYQLVCNGAVNLILADGAKLTATGDNASFTPAIQVAGSSNSLTIYGQAAQTGQLIANAGSHAAAIGGGMGVAGNNIYIYGGQITANGGLYAEGLGGGEGQNGKNIYVSTNLIVKASDWEENPTTVIENNGGDLASKLDDKRYVTVETPAKPISTSYIDKDGKSQEVEANAIIASTTTLSEGWYIVTDADLKTGTLVCNGAVNLILADGASLTATGQDVDAGIQVTGEGNSLTIYGQAGQTGHLTAIGGDNCAAGIGGGNNKAGSNITINGGIVSASGTMGSAGIGGGIRGAGSNITINSGKVEATGGACAAGIGGGYLGTGSNITINGGIVTANGGGAYDDNQIQIPAGDAIGNGSETTTAASNILIATSLVVLADGNEQPSTVITNTGADLAASLAGKRYATVGIEPSGLVDVNVNANVNKFFHNGQLIIRKENKTFNVLGQKL